ncbi:unnamed protein product [Rodentolepis nana]|uniref:Uncharacterized protein n=1 Tax=Rodentolepis nana TaxID=102285 RepID=A0A0R3THP9_RODNA|nr:unnamed protein product [Rodentolepis nana]
MSEERAGGVKGATGHNSVNQLSLPNTTTHRLYAQVRLACTRASERASVRRPNIAQARRRRRRPMHK